MSADRPAAEPPPVSLQHYRVLCGLALGVIFVILLQQGLAPFAAAAVLLGGAAVVLRVPLSPLLVLITVVGGQLYLQYQFDAPGRRARDPLQVEDVALCSATLAYVVGHYRLLSLCAYIVPPDPRHHQKGGAIVPLQRPAALLSRGELAWFVVQLPLFAILGQGMWMLLRPRRHLHGLRPEWVQLLQLAWGLALVLFVVGQFFRLRRLWQMDRTTAQMLLQDALWHETRGEQRRISRWLAWSRHRIRHDDR
jgi:hypothetical protein